MANSAIVIPFAKNSEQQCDRHADCALIKGHERECYLTEWIFDAKEREALRAVRKQAPFNWKKYTGQ